MMNFPAGISVSFIVMPLASVRVSVLREWSRPGGTEGFLVEPGEATRSFRALWSHFEHDERHRPTSNVVNRSRMFIFCSLCRRVRPSALRHED